MRRKCCLHDQPIRWTPCPTVTVCDSAAAAGPETPSGLGVGGTPTGRVSHTPRGSGGSTQATRPAPPPRPRPGRGCPAKKALPRNASRPCISEAAAGSSRQETGIKKSLGQSAWACLPCGRRAHRAGSRIWGAGERLSASPRQDTDPHPQMHGKSQQTTQPPSFSVASSLTDSSRRSPFPTQLVLTRPFLSMAALTGPLQLAQVTTDSLPVSYGGLSSAQAERPLVPERACGISGLPVPGCLPSCPQDVLLPSSPLAASLPSS